MEFLSLCRDVKHPDDRKVERGQRVLTLPVDSILPNPNQPRQTFDDSELWELSHSIKMYGVVQPVIVRKLGMGVYELIAGERRLRASKLAGIGSIPAILYEAEYSSLMMMTVIENLQRSNLNFVEEAKSYDTMMKQFGFTVEELAKKVGKNPYEISNRLRLLSLPHEVIKKLTEYNLTQYHANSLLRLKDSELQKEVTDIIISRGFDVSQTDAYVDKLISKGSGRFGGEVCKIHDVRILVNTIKQMSDILNRSGISSAVHVKDQGDFTEYTIVVPKQLESWVKQ